MGGEAYLHFQKFRTADLTLKIEFSCRVRRGTVPNIANSFYIIVGIVKNMNRAR